MRHYAGYSLLILSLFVAALPAAAQDVDIESRIDAILQNMTLDEKIGQTAMRGTSSRDEGSLSNELIEAVRSGRIGTMLNVTDRDIMDELQRIAVEESAHGIPIIFSRDVIHGYKTIFPIPLGLAATWNPDIVEEGARISAEEATTQGIRWTFAPAIDITRDPRWGRIAESPGEDPYLGSVLARAYVRGFQGDDLTDTRRMAATAKHFAAYGAAEGGRDYNTASLSENVLRDIYLPPFEAAIEEGVATFMTSFNDVTGVPATGSRYLLQNVLRGEWGFDGLVVSDWESVTEMIAHGSAGRSRRPSTSRPIRAGDVSPSRPAKIPTSVRCWHARTSAVFRATTSPIRAAWPPLRSTSPRTAPPKVVAITTRPAFPRTCFVTFTCRRLKLPSRKAWQHL